VELSSNPGDDGYDPVVWGVGEQIIDVTITPDMIVADDDPRLETVDISDLNPSTSNDGTELIAASKNGDGVSLTAQQISGNPVTDMLGLNLDRRRGFSDFSRTKPEYSATSGELYGLEPYLVNFAGTASAVGAFGAISGYDNVLLSVGTATNGNAGIVRAGSAVAILFDSTAELVTTWKVATSVLDGTNNGTIQIGFVNDFPDLCSRGMYFEHTGESPNWFACHTNSFNTSRVNTGVAVNPIIQTVFRVYYDPLDGSTNYYIDGVLVSTNTRSLIQFTQLQMAVTVRKSAGATPPTVGVSMHSFDVPPHPSAIGMDFSGQSPTLHRIYT